MVLSDELFGWVTDVNGRTSLVGVILPGVGHTPLIFADKERALKVEHIAVEHGRGLGQPVRLVRFKGAETIAAYPATWRQ